jgi:outer membrane protein assembly factor BamB
MPMMMKCRTILLAVLIFALALPALGEAPMPTVEPAATLVPWQRAVDENAIPDSARPDSAKLGVKTAVLDKDGDRVQTYAREAPISFGTSDDFTVLEGITTFRGSNYRDRASWGTIGAEPTKMTYKWATTIGGLDKWTGVGWTGQCAIVRWPEETKRVMNLYPDKKAKEDLVEVIYATLDGHIYFLDLDDGSATRDPINVGAPIKGSLSVDPRGYPLLYCGQGIPEVHGKSVPIGTRIFSLIDGSVLFFLDGRDKDAHRHWYAFDASPLIDGAADTMLQPGENGIFYTVKLNTCYDPDAGTVSVDPEVVKYIYSSNVSTRPGTENSVAVYNHYAYFADNSGLLQCVDVNTMKLLWAGDMGDDTDSTIVLAPEADGIVALYTANELDLRGPSGDCAVRKVNALTGEPIWTVKEAVKRRNDANGGAFATPALGIGSLEKYLYIQVARTEDGGTLLCIEKSTGNVAWRRSLKSYGWSSPVCVYADTGRGYVVVASSSGQMRLIDGLTGDLVCDIDMKANVEGSPAVFGNTLVVGTRGKKIVAVSFE